MSLKISVCSFPYFRQKLGRSGFQMFHQATFPGIRNDVP